jgi:flagellar biogenesis protein FliO|tara:strand:- start:158 stop:490 length:333 start_codon:yes stop_codon:yes gene_type:complete
LLETLTFEYFVRTIVAILFVAALLVLVVWAIKVRFKGKFADKESLIKVVQKTQIDPRHSVSILAYDNQKFLLASGPGGLALLEVQSPHAKTSDKFDKLLRKEIDNQGSQP